jgi:hypothetical protein
MIFLEVEGNIIGGLILVIIGGIDLVLSLLTRRRLRIAYLAGIVIGLVEAVGFVALTGLYLILTGDTLIALPIFGLIVMKAVIVFLLFREKNYFTEGFRKQEIPVKEGIPEIPVTTSQYQSESKEPVVLEYQAESLDQLFGPIKTGMSIIPMVEAIRLRGYQLPEREEFEKWINFRENIAKGIEKPEEAEIVDAYPFYRQIFDELGFK